MFTFGTMWAFFVFSRIFNTYWGINFVTLGERSPVNLVLAVFQFDGIVWGARQIVDLFPALAPFSTSAPMKTNGMVPSRPASISSTSSVMTSSFP